MILWVAGSDWRVEMLHYFVTEMLHSFVLTQHIARDKLDSVLMTAKQCEYDMQGQCEGVF